MANLFTHAEEQMRLQVLAKKGRLDELLDTIAVHDQEYQNLKLDRLRYCAHRESAFSTHIRPYRIAADRERKDEKDALAIVEKQRRKEMRDFSRREKVAKLADEKVLEADHLHRQQESAMFAVETERVRVQNLSEFERASLAAATTTTTTTATAAGSGAGVEMGAAHPQPGADAAVAAAVAVVSMATASEAGIATIAGTGNISINMNMYARSGGNNYYVSLGCSREATTEQIAAEYRARCLELHPDKITNPAEAAAVAAGPAWHNLQTANAVLSDPAKRALYDKWLQSDLAISYDDWLRAGPVRTAATHFASAVYQPPAATRALLDGDGGGSGAHDSPVHDSSSCGDGGGGAPDPKRPRLDGDAPANPSSGSSSAPEPLDQFRDANVEAAAALEAFRSGQDMSSHVK